MDTTADRMPIACVHCAKAKAKCDKKVPCTRCVGKQITCQSRATRRSSQHSNRRNNASRANPERSIQASTLFNVAKSSRCRPQNGHNTTNSREIGPHRQRQQHGAAAFCAQAQSAQISSLTAASEVDIALARPSQGNTPPELSLPITPMMQDAPQIDAFLGLNGLRYDSEADMRFFDMGDAHDSGMLDFIAQQTLENAFGLNSTFQDQDEFCFPDDKGIFPATTHMNGAMAEYLPMSHIMDMDSSSQNILFSPDGSPQRPASAYPMGDLQESAAIILSQKSWPFFQCNEADLFPSQTPKTATIYLEGLAQTLRDQATWQTWSSLYLDESIKSSSHRRITIEPIAGWPREKLLAIMQGFLHKALDIHRADQPSWDDTYSSPGSGSETFLMLPPPNVMQHFLENYAARYEPYYPLVAGRKLDPNILMYGPNSKAAALLTLLMTACGASASSAIEARLLSSGLTEACRISLFDSIEKDVLQAREALVLRSALLFTCLAAWSGDKWHMDMAMGQRGLYLAMLSHSGMLGSSGSYLETGNCKANPDKAWEDWKEHEGQHKLAHSWIFLDQEMSLFSDTPPLLSIVDLHTPISDADNLWHAQSSTEWLGLFEQIHTLTYQSPPSVRDLFSRFVEGDLEGKSLSPTNIRLLLHPLQAQVCQLRQFMTCMPYNSGQQADATSSGAATKARLDELNLLLERWFALSNNSSSISRGPCWATYANLILYHLISLTAITSFKCIERLARKEMPITASSYTTWLRNRCVDQPEKTYFHCGQILRLLQSLPGAVRPPWWAGAVYRVALTAWATSIAYNDLPGDGSEGTIAVGPQFAIDRLLPDNETISRYLRYKVGTPMFTSLDGQLVSLSDPNGIVLHCAGFLGDDLSMRLTDGIKRKLHLLIDNWSHA